MDHAYRVRVSNKDMDDTYYFKTFPTRGELIKQIQKNQGLADDIWHGYYDTILEQVKVWNEYPSYMSSRMSMQGFPLPNECSIAFERFNFCD